MLAKKWWAEENLKTRNGFRQRHTGTYRKGNLRKQQLTTAEQGHPRKKRRNNMRKRTVE